MKIISEEPYIYILVQDGNNWYLTFFTSGPMVVDVCVKLNTEEISKVKNNKEEALALANSFQRNRSLFEGRRVIPSIVP